MKKIYQGDPKLFEAMLCTNIIDGKTVSYVDKAQPNCVGVRAKSEAMSGPIFHQKIYLVNEGYGDSSS